MGYTLTAAVSSGEDAIDRINGSPPDIILMDITLDGEMDGIDSAKYINETYDIPVIYITSSSEVETVERVKDTNAFGYILKPIDRRELKATIEMALLRHDMERTLKDNENKFSTILNSIGDAVIVADSAGNITYMNPVAEFMTGSSYSSNLGKKLKAVIHIENETLENIKGGRSFSLRQEKGHNYLVSSSGKKIPVDYSISPQKDKAGNLIGTVMVLRDINERVKSEERLEESFQQLRKAMGGVIQAMAQTVETRDPYTAGHQRRVADLARSIADEMTLPYNKIEGIRMAGTIHDLGKISIPAEILSKPGRISPIEFSLIKGHPQTGYDILKTIDFPWPVADIVHQHHERLDGSGYPLGLTGDDILIESKIIAVADVVEAMASHRPYRAALGIDIAIDEISKNRGIFYDKDAVDACIKIFKVDGYSMG
ncbi:MAG TPA: HD domain-containing phosphohydrolase [Spirochaetota bacterium]|nr:HD domain-containing phosphohydrolase [Spirochaetota bacterium]HPI87788.1 HD domain-containing phosphohydrolase [Spirochaetota bacterium]HPR47036.1 HD domain-containing phosphohydrolase [Spirochaetota bacterium]